MTIDSIKNGIVLDHITAGKGMILYKTLGLNKLESQVAIITNANSKRMGRKDIIKIDEALDINLDIIGYLDPDVSVVIIKDGKIAQKYRVGLPKKIINIAKCKNPRCITSVEQELDQIFVLADEETQTYRCEYCEAKLKK